MAKAENIAIRPDEEFADAAARIVRVRARELFEQSAGVLDATDIERVHAMRVASRRLRAVLEIFAVCFPRREHQAVLRDVKQLADALGERRDPDVQIAAMQAFTEQVDAIHRPGVELLVADLSQRQAAGNRVLERALDHAERTQLAARLQQLAAHAAPQDSLAPVGEADPAESIAA